MQEIEFWLTRAKDLNNILQQIKGEPIQNVMKTLRSANSGSYFAMLTLTDNVTRAANEATSIAHFLATVRSYCLKYAVSF